MAHHPRSIDGIDHTRQPKHKICRMSPVLSIRIYLQKPVDIRPHHSAVASDTPVLAWHGVPVFFMDAKQGGTAGQESSPHMNLIAGPPGAFP